MNSTLEEEVQTDPKVISHDTSVPQDERRWLGSKGGGSCGLRPLRRTELNKAKQVIIGHMETMTHNSTLPESWDSSVM